MRTGIRYNRFGYSEMLYIQDTCPVCGNGVVGFYRCSDGKTIAFLCDECGTVWDQPNVCQTSPVQFFNEPNPPLPGHQCSLGGSMSGWATRQEIDNAGLSMYIAGEHEATGA
jgi:hypothetical protein